MKQKFQEFLYHDWLKDGERLKKKNIRLVHYTSSDVAIKIIESSSVWMRAPLSMNDFEEIEFARNSLVKAYSDNSVLSVRNDLDKKYPGFCKDFESRMNHWMHRLDTNSFLFCLSEHTAEEDETGRLSMWRAYGRKNGAALVISRAAIDDETGEIDNIFFVPVKYARKEQIQMEFVKFFVGLKKFIKSPEISKEDILNGIFYSLILKIIRTKHIGFAEEKEWRLFVLPELYENPHVIKNVVSIDGVPQIIGVLNIEKLLQHGKSNIGFNMMLDRIIVGPTDHPIQIRDALTEKLRDRGILDPEKKVFLSNIPLRS